MKNFIKFVPATIEELPVTGYRPVYGTGGYEHQYEHKGFNYTEYCRTSNKEHQWVITVDYHTLLVQVIKGDEKIISMLLINEVEHFDCKCEVITS